MGSGRSDIRRHGVGLIVLAQLHRFVEASKALPTVCPFGFTCSHEDLRCEIGNSLLSGSGADSLNPPGPLGNRLSWRAKHLSKGLHSISRLVHPSFQIGFAWSGE